ncbi:MAG: cellulase family glycosylhydrolase [Candidatus Sumerlaeota bacterium]|nr:cellulase family glycosylhydrolase [Candidatus Sumerlaeota bacterium]
MNLFAKFPCLFAFIFFCAGAVLGAPTQLPAPRVPDGAGVNIHFVVPNEKELDLLAQGGFKFIRMDFAWGGIERKKGEYDFSGFDKLVAALEKRGIRALFILDYSNKLYEKESSVATEEGRQAFARYAAAGARQYKGKGILWEIWNEPNIPNFWKPKPDAEQYAKMAVAAARAVREADPETYILAPASSTIDLKFMEACFKGGLLDTIDAVSVHPYRGGAPETVAAEYVKLRALIARYAPAQKQTMPIVSGEWGYSCTNISRDLQGKYLPRQYLANLACGVPISIWYDWRDDGTNPKDAEHNFGTVERGMNPKPAYLASQTHTSVLKGYEFWTRIYTGDEKDWTLVFRKGDQWALAAWIADAGTTRTISLPLGRCEGSRYTHTSGDARSFSNGDGGAALSVADAPQYFPMKSIGAAAVSEISWRLSPALLALRAGGEAQLALELENPGAPCDGELIMSGPDGWEAREKFTAPKGRSTQSIPVKWTLRAPETFNLTARLMLGSKRLETQRLIKAALVNPLSARLIPIPSKGIALELQTPDTKENIKASVEFEGGGQPVSVQIQAGKPLLAPLSIAPLEDGSLFKVPPMRLKDERGNLMAQWPARTLRVAFDFSKIGIQGWRAQLDGDKNVPCTASLSLADAPRSSDPLAAFSKAMKLDYQFASGWRFICLNPPDSLRAIQGTPKAVGIWVYEDGSGNMLNCRIDDPTHQTIQPHAGNLTESGWRYLEAPLSGAWHWGGANDAKPHPPLRWNTPFLLDSAKKDFNRSAVYIGAVALIYD